MIAHTFLDHLIYPNQNKLTRESLSFSQDMANMENMDHLKALLRSKGLQPLVHLGAEVVVNETLVFQRRNVNVEPRFLSRHP